MPIGASSAEAIVAHDRRWNMEQGKFLNMFFLCVINVIFMITGILLNSVVIISLRKSSTHRNKLCNYMVLVLSCFDLAVVTITHPVLILSAVCFSHGDYNELREQIRISICMLLDGFSMWSLLMLTIERFLGIIYPIFHRTSVTKKRLLSFLGVLLVLNIVQSTLSFQNFLIPDNILVVVYLPFYLLTLFFLNYKMFVVAKAKSRINVLSNSTCTKENSKHIFELKKVSTCFLAIMCFFLCSFPGIVISGLCAAQKVSLYDETVLPLSLWFTTIVSINSTFNCLIFFWRNSLLRRHGLKLLKYFLGQRSDRNTFLT